VVVCSIGSSALVNTSICAEEPCVKSRPWEQLPPIQGISSPCSLLIYKSTNERSNYHQCSPIESLGSDLQMAQKVASGALDLSVNSQSLSLRIS
jgi:hypothetical protein